MNENTCVLTKSQTIDLKNLYIFVSVFFIVFKSEVFYVYPLYVVIKAVIDAVILSGEIFKKDFSKINGCLFAVICVSYVYPIFNFNIYLVPVFFGMAYYAYKWFGGFFIKLIRNSF